MRKGLLLAVLLMACGSDEANPTVGEMCQYVGNDYCWRGVECGLMPSADVSACVSSFSKGCCVDRGTCAQESREDWDWANDCGDAISTFSCAGMEQYLVPAQCMM